MCMYPSSSPYLGGSDLWQYRITTIDYQERQHEVDFVLTPYYSAGNLSWANALQTLQLKYKETLLYDGPGSVKTSGLDALGILPAAAGEPALPIANATYQHLTVDAEGLALNADST
jgi:hypothetical protein